MQEIVRFLSYHNAVPIALSILLLSFGAAFAASENVRDAVFSSQQRVVSVDNSYIASKDLSSYTPKIEITGVTEDDEHYYVAYQFHTIDVQDAVWQEVVKTDTLKVAKSILGEYGDLGLYATVQFKQLVDRELAYLREVQGIERRQVTPKVVATEYAGLVGRFLDASTETLPGYVPVVTPPTPEPIAGVATPAVQGESQVASAGAMTSGPGAPVIQVLGNNPARIPIKTSYSDLGVVVTDDSGREFTVKKFVEGVPVQDISIDTTEPKEWHIRYEATDNDGNTSSAERLLIVFDPNPPLVPPAEDTASSTAAVKPVTSGPTSGATGTEPAGE